MTGDGSLLLTNGKIWTGTSFARSVTIRCGRITALDEGGTAVDRRLDLGGRLAVPGLIDNHLHFVTGSLQLGCVQLRDADSPRELALRIAAHAARSRPGAWVTGGGWDEQRWNPAVLPVRADVDDVTRETPVFVTRLDLHMGLANGAALRLAGITRDTQDPAGGVIVRDASGEPTGILKDTAMGLVTRVVPQASRNERAAAIREGLRFAASLGLTGFCDMGLSAEAFEDLRAYQQLDRDGELTARVWMYLPIGDWELLARAGITRGFGSARLRIAGLKAFSDGSLGSSTAAFDDPYADDPRNRGLLMRPMEDGSMARFVTGADKANLQLAIHAIGDRAAAAVLDLLERQPACASRRFRVEHAQHLNAALVRRFAQSGVIAAAQPYHLADDGRWAEKKIGAERTRWAFPFRSLLDAGAALTFGSDWPVAPLDPIEGLHAAVTRQTLGGGHPGGWIPEQRIGVEEALRGYTSTNAWAQFAEGELGKIAPGMRADLTILSRDLFTIPPEEIRSVQADMTIVGGRVVFER